MAENRNKSYSVDDILAELDKKSGKKREEKHKDDYRYELTKEGRGEVTETFDAMLGQIEENDSVIKAAEKKSSVGVTQILKDISGEAKPRVEEKPTRDLTTTAILSGLDEKAEKPVKVEKPVEVKKPVEAAKPVPAEKPVEVKKPVEAAKPVEVKKPKAADDDDDFYDDSFLRPAADKASGKRRSLFNGFDDEEDEELDRPARKRKEKPEKPEKPEKSGKKHKFGFMRKRDEEYDDDEPITAEKPEKPVKPVVPVKPAAKPVPEEKAEVKPKSSDSPDNAVIPKGSFSENVKLHSDDKTQILPDVNISEAVKSRVEDKTIVIPKGGLHIGNNGDIIPAVNTEDEHTDTGAFEIADAEFSFPKNEETKVIAAAKKSVDLAQTRVIPSQPRVISDTAVRRKNEEMLKRDMALEEPDELLDAINPLELEKTKVLPKLSKPEAKPVIPDTAQIGDTMSIAGNELRELAERGEHKDKGAKKLDDSDIMLADTGEIVPGMSYTKPYIFTNTTDFAESGEVKTDGRNDDALLRSINKAIAADAKTHRTATLPAINGGFTKGVEEPTLGLNIDYKNQVLPDTGIIPAEALTREKLREMEQARKRKIRDFVLQTDDEETSDEEDEEQEDERDFDSYDTTSQIWADLNDSHRGLKVRFCLLLVITLFVTFITIMNDFGQDMTFNLFGNAIDILDKRFNPSGFLYTNMILGVIGMGICASVISGGIGKLFSRKPDCDTICAVSSALSLVGMVLHLSNPDFIQRSKAFVYIAAGLCALLFNTIGKLLMIVRAKRNFSFVAGESAKYSAAIVQDEAATNAFTKGVITELPVLAAMRKTEFLTDFLRSSYCTDKADRMSGRLTVIGLIFAAVIGVASYFLPGGEGEMAHNLFWSVTCATAALSVLSPFSMMFLVNVPLLRCSKALSKYDAVVLGYSAVEEFSAVNSALVDASLLFPVGSVAFRNLKRCQPANAINSIAIDEAIILAASLAIKSGSIMKYMFYDMIGGKNELLRSVENCIYEDNMGIMGWYGNKRMMLGNRDQMKHHGIKVPDIKKERQYCSENGEVVYLAVGGETIAMFFVELIANPAVKRNVQQLVDTGVSLIIRTNDSLVTVNRLADVFDIPPELIKVIPFGLHEQFKECTKYVSRASGAVACKETFSSFAKAITYAKIMMHDIGLTSSVIWLTAFLGALLVGVFTFAVLPVYISATAVILYNTGALLVLLLGQHFRRFK